MLLFCKPYSHCTTYPYPCYSWHSWPVAAPPAILLPPSRCCSAGTLALSCPCSSHDIMVVPCCPCLPVPLLSVPPLALVPGAHGNLSATTPTAATPAELCSLAPKAPLPPAHDLMLCSIPMHCHHSRIFSNSLYISFGHIYSGKIHIYAEVIVANGVSTNHLGTNYLQVVDRHIGPNLRQFTNHLLVRYRVLQKSFSKMN